MTDSQYEDLDAQLRAWLDQDEALAQTCLAEPFDRGDGVIVDPAERWPPGELKRYEGSGYVPRDWVRARVPFVTAHSPAAVLADIAGKRALLDHVAGWGHEYVDGDTWFSCSQAESPNVSDDFAGPGSGCADERRAGKPCDCGLDARRLAVLRCLAVGYAGRAGFDGDVKGARG